MKLVGLTGGIACGKSTASAVLKRLGVPIVDCDQIAREVVEKGKWGYRRTLAAFSTQNITLANGEIDREKLANIIFLDPAARRRLNAATHLPVFFAILRKAFCSWLTFHPLIVIDMPLLFETKFFKVTKPNILIRCQYKTQVERLMARDGLERAAAEARIQAQMPLEVKERLADIIIDNHGTIDSLERQVEEIYAATLKKRGFWLHKTILSPAGVVAAIALVVWRCIG